MNPYQYRPLRKEEGEMEGEIRLIRLLPGHGSDDIKLEIFHAPLESVDTVYEALSYAWGSSEKTDRVIVRDTTSPSPINISRGHKLKPFQPSHRFTKWREKATRSLHRKPSVANTELQEPTSKLEITSNLAIALMHLREDSSVADDAAHGRILWIDAICINQEDIIERSEEVGRMKSIYPKARRVILWLGPESNNSTRAMETLAEIGPGIVNHNANTNTFIMAEGSLAGRLYNSPEDVQARGADWVAIRDLLQRPWFRRLWVYQEIHLAAEATIVVGRASLPWSFFQNITVWLHALIYHDSFVSHIISKKEIRTITALCATLEAAGVRDLKFLIDRTAHLACIDPRDRIYALLGLSNEKVLLHTIPSYSSSTEEIYLDVITRQIAAQPRLRHLGLCVMPGEGTSQVSLQLPSWVPDFTVERPFGLARWHYPDGLSRHEAVIRADRNLVVTGALSSAIVHVGKGIPQDADEDEIRNTVRSWAPADLHLTTTSYVGGGTCLDAFAISLVCGFIVDNLPLGSGGYPSVDSCRRACLAICSDNSHEDAKLPNLVQIGLPGRRYFRTSNGYLGICPNATEVGDFVTAILGARVLIVVRPVKDIINHYQIVGECYLHGWMNCEAFIGHLPGEWILEWGQVNNNDVRMYRCGDLVTQQDPRLGALPLGWKIIFQNEQDRKSYTEEFDEDSNVRLMMFVDTTTGKRSEFDPRLTSTFLRSRGVDVKDLIIV